MYKTKPLEIITNNKGEVIWRVKDNIQHWTSHMQGRLSKSALTTKEEILSSIRKLKCNKGIGPDNKPGYVLKFISKPDLDVVS